MPDGMNEDTHSPLSASRLTSKPSLGGKEVRRVYMSERWGWEGADCQVSSLTMETAVRAAAVFFFFRAIYPPPSPSCQLSMALQCICTIQTVFAGGGKSEWKEWERKIRQRHRMWMCKSRNAIETKKNLVMRILQAAYACIRRETELQDNKMRGAGVSVWRESDRRFRACTSENGRCLVFRMLRVHTMSTYIHYKTQTHGSSNRCHYKCISQIFFFGTSKSC